MSQTQNKTCALCHAYLFEEDDVVYCPVCGAPHHRECYNSIGHCALEDTHGTENQYDLLKQKTSNQQQTQPQQPQQTANNKSEHYIPGDEIFQNLPPLDFLGGVPADHIIEDGVTAKEARNFVISNTTRYIPKFAYINKKHKSSWNWMAFFFPHAWLLSRKMYKSGFIMTFFMLISKLLLIPFLNNLEVLGYEDTLGYAETIEFFNNNTKEINITAALVAFAGVVLYFGIKIIMAIYGDYIYRQHTISKIKEIKQKSDDIAGDYRKYGGVNLYLCLIGIVATMYLPDIIAGLIG